MNRNYDKLAEGFISTFGLYDEYTSLDADAKEKVKTLALAYMLTYDATPARFDCGRLCSHACCKGDRGMFLLPGEEFFAKRIDGARVCDGDDGKVLYCEGRCERALRPFACRVFPYYISFSDENRASLRCDLRSASLCPIAKRRRIRIGFIRGIKRAAAILFANAEIRKDLVSTSEFCDSLYELYEKMHD